MIGIKEIAKEANVSPATVSRVLHNPELVSEAKRNQVLEVVKRTGYTPNSLGVSLRKAKTHKLVAIIPDVICAFNYPVIRAIESMALDHGYSLLLGDTQELECRERSFAAMAKSRQADGIFLFCSRLPFDLDESLSLSEQLPPMVNACEMVDISGIPKVNIDNRAAGTDATDYLLSLGHQRIAVVAGNLQTPSTIERLEGYKTALNEAGLPYRPEYVQAANYSLALAAEATRKIMTQPHRPTAIFAFSDEMAMSCISTLTEMGLNVPADVSVMGFDNISYSAYMNPALTTVAQPMAEIGRKCMELILPQLEGEPMREGMHLLPHELIVRKSTGPVKANACVG